MKKITKEEYEQMLIATVKAIVPAMNEIMTKAMASVELMIDLKILANNARITGDNSKVESEIDKAVDKFEQNLGIKEK